MLTFYGDCYRHDFVLAVATVLSVNSETTVTIVTDDDRNYKYLSGESEGVKISKGITDNMGIPIFDCHNTILSDLKETKLVLCTTLEKPVIDMSKRVLEKHTPDASLLILNDSKIPRKYLSMFLDTPKVFEYEDDFSRKYDCLFNGRLDFRRMDKYFVDAVNSFAVEMLDVPKDNLKQIWTFLKKRG